MKYDSKGLFYCHSPYIVHKPRASLRASAMSRGTNCGADPGQATPTTSRHQRTTYIGHHTFCYPSGRKTQTWNDQSCIQQEVPRGSKLSFSKVVGSRSKSYILLERIFRDFFVFRAVLCTGSRCSNRCWCNYCCWWCNYRCCCCCCYCSEYRYVIRTSYRPQNTLIVPLNV